MAAEMRVTHILEATLGGTARHLADVGCGLAGAGFSVEAIVSLRRAEGFEPKAERLRAAGVSLVEVPMAREVSPAGDAGALWRLVRQLRRSRPDVVHTHSSKAGVLGRAAAALAGVPVIIHSPHAFAFQMRSARPKRILYLALERLAGRRTNCLVAVSQAEAGLAVGAKVMPKSRVVVIENGVDPAEAASAEEGAAARRALGIGPAEPVVLFVGRLVEQKAPEVFVRAALAVRQAWPEAVFLLAGEGPLRPALEGEIRRASAERSIRLLGYRDDAARLYAGAEVFVLPSRWEGFSYTVLEAMAAGVPVVAGRLPCMREAVGECGILVPTDDPQALADAVLSLLAGRESARRLGAAGRERVRTLFTLERQVARLGELYRSLAAT